MATISSTSEQSVVCKLPALKELAPRPTQPAWTSSAVYAVLRKAALENCTNNFEPFYSIRSVGAHFDVPTATVRRVFQRLSAEKLLRTVWGSGTLLEPSENDKTRRARVITVPIALGVFTGSANYRAIIRTIQRQIWECGGTERLVFLEYGSTELLRLFKRLGLRRMNMVIWPLPDTGDRETILCLRDLGIRVTCLGRLPLDRNHNYETPLQRRTVQRIIRQEVLGAHGQQSSMKSSFSLRVRPAAFEGNHGALPP